ncbi:hypothetical protein H0H93_016990, partial [Arthromyces matolae]
SDLDLSGLKSVLTDAVSLSGQQPKLEQGSPKLPLSSRPVPHGAKTVTTSSQVEPPSKSASQIPSTRQTTLSPSTLNNSLEVIDLTQDSDEDFPAPPLRLKPSPLPSTVKTLEKNDSKKSALAPTPVVQKSAIRPMPLPTPRPRLPSTSQEPSLPSTLPAPIPDLLSSRSLDPQRHSPADDTTSTSDGSDSSSESTSVSPPPKVALRHRIARKSTGGLLSKTVKMSPVQARTASPILAKDPAAPSLEP